jgi:hypothetical protein
MILMLLVLYAPGWLIYLAGGFAALPALVLAPTISVVWMCVAGIVYDLVGIPANIVTVFAPLAIAAIATVALRRLRGHNEKPSHRLGENLTVPAACLYVAVGAVSCALLYLYQRTDMSSFIYQWDNDTHLGVIRAFADSQKMSTLHVSSYLTAGDLPADPFGNTSGYYPAAFHELCALIVLARHVTAPLAVNASIAVMGAVIFPLSMSLFVSELFDYDHVALYSGAVLCGLFPAMPYAGTFYGPVYPNIFAVSLLPVGLALAFRLMRDRESRRPSTFVVLLVTLITLAFVHPNALFSLGVICVPTLTVQVAREERAKGASGLRSFVIGALVLFAFVVLWGILFIAPPLRGVVTGQFVPTTTVGDAIRSMFLFLPSSFLQTIGGGQPILFVLVAVGIVADIVKRRFPGLVATYVLLQVMCIIATSTFNLFKQILTGFWYTDSNRLAAILAIVSIALAAEGVSWIAEGVRNLMARKPRRKTVDAAATVVTATAVLLVVVLEGYGIFPNEGGTLARLQYTLNGAYGDWNAYTVNERGAVRELKGIVGDDIVANSTYDGSLFAYGSDDVHMLYRFNDNLYNIDGEATDTADAQLVRTKLNEIASNPEVKAAAERLGVRWVAQLDTTHAIQEANGFYRAEDWVGIESVDENTPGFQLAYQNGYVKLYKITAY